MASIVGVQSSVVQPGATWPVSPGKPLHGTGMERRNIVNWHPGYNKSGEQPQIKGRSLVLLTVDSHCWQFPCFATVWNDTVSQWVKSCCRILRCAMGMMSWPNNVALYFILIWNFLSATALQVSRLPRDPLLPWKGFESLRVRGKAPSEKHHQIAAGSSNPAAGPLVATFQ